MKHFFTLEIIMGYDFTKRYETGAIGTSGEDSKLRDGASYIMIAESAEERTTKRGDGKYINIKFSVVDGACDGKTIWAVFNIENPSAKAANIGLEALDKFAKSLGYADGKIEDLKLLCYIPFLGTLKTKLEPNGELRFSVAKFEALEQAEKERVAAKWTSSQNLHDDVETPF